MKHLPEATKGSGTSDRSLDDLTAQRRQRSLAALRRHPRGHRSATGKHPSAEAHPIVGETIGTGAIRVICIYPDAESAKMARHWIISALRDGGEDQDVRIEYFSYAMLSGGGICWKSVAERIQPDVILILGDGGEPLNPGLRNSLHDLFAFQNGKHPVVLFRNMERRTSLNAQTILDYISALTHRNHCSLHALDGNGDAIECYRRPRLLLRTRIRYE